MPEIYHTASAEETEQLGYRLAEQVKDRKLPPFLALYGGLGVGKTAFVRGFTAAIAPGAPVRSPTFALVHEYPAVPRPVFHFDLYRIGGEDDLISIGFDDYLHRNGIILTEWSENIPDFLPDSYLEVTLEKDDPHDPDSRKITVREIGCETKEVSR